MSLCIPKKDPPRCGDMFRNLYINIPQVNEDSWGINIKFCFTCLYVLYVIQHLGPRNYLVKSMGPRNYLLKEIWKIMREFLYNFAIPRSSFRFYFTPSEKRNVFGCHKKFYFFFFQRLVHIKGALWFKICKI